MQRHLAPLLLLQRLLSLDEQTDAGVSGEAHKGRCAAVFGIVDKLGLLHALQMFQLLRWPLQHFGTRKSRLQPHQTSRRVVLPHQIEYLFALNLV